MGSEQVKELNLCGNCSKVRHIGESGYKIFTFKNPYLGNTCVPFIHWACSYECAQEIEVPARKQQLKSAKEQDRIYDKYVRKSREDLLQMNNRPSRSSRTGRRSHRIPANRINQFSTMLANVQDDNISTSSSQDLQFLEERDIENTSMINVITQSDDPSTSTDILFHNARNNYI